MNFVRDVRVLWLLPDGFPSRNASLHVSAQTQTWPGSLLIRLTLKVPTTVVSIEGLLYVRTPASLGSLNQLCS